MSVPASRLSTEVKALGNMQRQVSVQMIAFISPILLIAGDQIAQAQAKTSIDHEASGYTVVIRRDEWGMAHVHGKTHEDAFFGMGYVQAEDDFWQLEDTCIRSLGRYSEVTGEAGIRSDLLNRTFEVARRSQEDFLKLAPHHRAMAIAYTDGINAYLKAHPDTKPRLVTQFEPWNVLAMDRQMLLHFIYRQAHVRQPADRPPGAVAQSSRMPPLVTNSWELTTEPLSGFAAEIQAAIGSNAWAISGKKTKSGAAMLFINPHLPWYGIGQFHEAHLSSDEGLNFSGAGFLGSPLPTVGHNEFLGWTYTVNSPDIADAWQVTFDDPEHPLRYRYNGGYRDAAEWTETLVVIPPDGKEPQERSVTFRKTHHGPIVNQKSETTYLAVQIAGLFDLHRVDQAWGMVLARNFTEWRTAMSYCGIPMFNVVYADRDGNIFYAYNGSIPIRDPQFNWRKPVDGSDPRTEWKGRHTFDQLPQVLNPLSGYVQSCNSTPFTTTDHSEDNPQSDRFPNYMLEDGDIDMRRSKMSRLLLSESQDLTFSQLQVLAYDTTLYWPLTELPQLRQSYPRLQETDPVLANEIGNLLQHLLDWNCKSTLDSTQTTLCVAWYEELYGFGYPAETLKEEYAADRLTWFKGLKKAGQKLTRLYGTWKYPWGETHRLQRIAHQSDVMNAAVLFSGLPRSLPIAGAPGPLGVMHTVYSTPEIPVLRPQRYAVAGASYLAVVEFTQPIQCMSIMPFGVSGNPESPHFFDQAELYASQKMKRAWFSREEVIRYTKSMVELHNK